MAKFCNQCGRPLQEGEVCNCTAQQQNLNNQQPYGGPQGGAGYQQPYGGPQRGAGYQQPYGGPQQGAGYQQPYGGPQQGAGYQQPYGGPQRGAGYQQPYGTPQGGQQYQRQYQVPPRVTNFVEEFKLFFLRFLPFIKDPIGELKSTYKRNNLSSGLYMFLADFIMMLIYLIVLCIRVSIMIKSELSNRGVYGFGDYNYDPGIPYFRIIFGVLFVMVIYHFAASGILCGFSKVFSKNNITFAQTMTVTGSVHWYMCFFLVIATILTIIHPIAGLVILAIGILFTQFIGIISFCELVTMKSSNKLYTWVIYVVLKTIVFVILYAVILASVISYLENAF